MTAIDDMRLKMHEAEERAAALERLLLPFLWEGRRCSRSHRSLAIERVCLAFDDHPVKPRARSTFIIGAAASFNGDLEEYASVLELEGVLEKMGSAERKASTRKPLGRPRKEKGAPGSGVPVKRWRKRAGFNG